MQQVLSVRDAMDGSFVVSIRSQKWKRQGRSLDMGKHEKEISHLINTKRKPKNQSTLILSLKKTMTAVVLHS